MSGDMAKVRRAKLKIDMVIVLFGSERIILRRLLLAVLLLMTSA